MKQHEVTVPMVTITKYEYDQLKKDQHFLRCLEGGGVDSWDWYGEAAEMHEQEYLSE